LESNYKAGKVPVVGRTKAVAEVTEVAGKSIPKAPLFAGKIGLTPDAAGLKSDNYELYRVAIWISSVIKLLVSKITGDKVAEKVAALETVVAKHFSSDPKLYDGSLNMSEFMKDVRALFSKKAGDLAFDGTFDEFKATTEDISNKLTEAGSLVPSGTSDISVSSPIRTTLLSWPKFIEDLV
jgi:hypothetical protein